MIRFTVDKAKLQEERKTMPNLKLVMCVVSQLFILTHLLLFALILCFECRTQITLLKMGSIIIMMIEGGHFQTTQARRDNRHSTLCLPRRMTTLPQIATIPIL